MNVKSSLLLAVIYFVAVVLDQTLKLTIVAGHILKCAKRPITLEVLMDSTVI